LKSKWFGLHSQSNQYFNIFQKKEMADIFTKKKRSQIMASIRSSETKPEIAVRKFLFSQGFRYRKNVKGLPGSPDIVLPKYKTVIFVHGCFWHGHKNCEAASTPKSNSDYWKNKIDRNIQRDIKNKRELRKLGWRVITVWECTLRNKKTSVDRLNKLAETLQN
jgi:DNA mismatch endonuclease (patch repair protein)